MMNEPLQKNIDEDEKKKIPIENQRRKFLIPLIASSIPFIVLLIIMAVRVGKGGELVWMGTVLWWVITLLFCGGFAIASKRWISLGLLAGAVLGLAVIVFSCTVTLPTK
jgi:uncharacterized membrane protein YagU involved in acid resistance